MRVALVHDWLTGMRGGERCLERIVRLFPDADLYTLFHTPGATSPAIDAMRIQKSWLSSLPGATRHYRKFLPLFPRAIEAFDLRDYDLILSSSHAVAKGVRTRPDQAHVCYCFTPMRYIWDQADAYLGRGATRALASPLVAYLRHFDRTRSTPDRVSRFVAISHCVAARIRTHYGREADVVFPPVELDRFAVGPAQADRDDFYLLVGGFVPYKRDALAVQAFARPELAGRRLVVVGDGPGRAAAQALAPPGVEFKGRVDDAELAALLGRARALLYPQLEDFGIAAVEAQACGTPVIAFGAGGALDTVVPLGPGREDATGLFFEDASPAGLAAAILRFEAERAAFDPQRIRKWAEGFAPDRFDAQLRAQVDAALGEPGCQ